MIINPMVYSGKKLPELENPGDAADLLAGKQLLDQNGEPLTGTMPQRSAADLTASGATVTVPAGCYPSQVSKSVPSAGALTGQLGTTSGLTNVTGTPPKGTGKIAVTNVQQTAGYTNGYSNGTLTLDVPNLYQGRTIIPSTTEQVAIEAEGVAYNRISVAGDANLIPSNIKDGISIFGVTGSCWAVTTIPAGITNNSSHNITLHWTNGELYFATNLIGGQYYSFTVLLNSIFVVELITTGQLVSGASGGAENIFDSLAATIPRFVGFCARSNPFGCNLWVS